MATEVHGHFGPLLIVTSYIFFCSLVGASRRLRFGIVLPASSIEEQTMSLDRDYEDLKALAQLRVEQDPERHDPAQERALRRLYEQVDHHIRRQQEAGFSLGLDQHTTAGQRGDSGSIYETVFYTPDNKEVIMLGRVIYDFIAHASR